MYNALQIIPDQYIGRSTDFTHEKIYDSIELAHKAFNQVAERLLTINNWHEYTGAGSAKFSLCNNSGDELSGFPSERDYFSIDLPGPGPDAGNGLEWVMIEKIIVEGNANTAEEYVAMTVRPAPDPHNANSTVAHFYTDDSTSTFIARRNGRVIITGAHGRNETPNNESVDLHDKIRNTAIALIARIGLSGGQWQKFVNGLIEYQSEK